MSNQWVYPITGQMPGVASQKLGDWYDARNTYAQDYANSLQARVSESCVSVGDMWKTRQGYLVAIEARASGPYPFIGRIIFNTDTSDDLLWCFSDSGVSCDRGDRGFDLVTRANAAHDAPYAFWLGAEG